VPRFYSPEWVAAFNEAVADLDPAGVDLGGSLAAGGERWQVAQVVQGAPGGDLRVTLAVAGGRLRLAVTPADAAADDPGDESPDVTVSLSYDDARAMSRGELDPAEAIGQGRVRVRGDLAVLVAGQALLAAAAGRLAPLQAATTY
jgi:hypothetical protein